MLEALVLATRRGANLLAVGVQLLVQAIEIESGARGPQILQREHRLRDQVDRGLAAATLEAKMKCRRDAVERIDNHLEVAVGAARLDFEHLGRLEVLAAIKPLDRFINGGRFGDFTHCNIAD